MRQRGIDDVPVGRTHRLMLPGLQVHAAQGGELALVVGRVIEPLAIRAEGLGRELRLALVFGHLGQLAGGQLGHVQVVVVGGVGLRKRQPAAVGRDLARLVAGVVAVDQFALVVIGVVAVDVEELRITLVADDVEGVAVMAEAHEAGLEVFARREVAFAAVGLDHVQVVELVAPFIAAHQHAVVVREEGFGVDVVGVGRRHGGPFTAAHGHRVRVPDAGLVGGEKDARFVGAERGAADADRFDELLDRVLPRGPRLDLGLGLRRGAGLWCGFRRALAGRNPQRQGADDGKGEHGSAKGGHGQDSRA